MMKYKRIKMPGRTPIRTFFLSFSITVAAFLALGAFIIYGPFTEVRDYLITTAMGTMNHKWIATEIYNSEAIENAMARNHTEPLSESTNPSSIQVSSSSVKDNAAVLPEKPSEGEHIIDGIGFIRIAGKSYNGWVIKIYDPSRIRLALSKDIGTMGEKTTAVCKRLDALAAVNAGAFSDLNGHGTGGTPCGLCIADGRQVDSNMYHGVHPVVGMDLQNKLVLENLADSQIKAKNYKFAVEFAPFLIVNGIPAKIRGNGGYGYDPRTAIGQTKDGVIIFVVIDGRKVNCIGASIKDLQNIMLSYQAVNASNLDGGSSTTFSFRGRLVNAPSGPSGERFVPSAFVISKK